MSRWHEWIEAQLGAAKLGPDALATTPEGLHETFRYSRRPVKVALLDQQRVAGIGGVLAGVLQEVLAVQLRRDVGAAQVVAQPAEAIEGFLRINPGWDVGRELTGTPPPHC